jgi:hypothetical protein
MYKISEILLTALVLVGMYCAVSTSSAPVTNPVIRSQQAVLVADGTDPMPVCRGNGKRSCQ